MRAVSLAILVGVLKNNDAVTFRATVLILTIIDSLGHPDPPFGIGVHIGWVQEHRACRPSRDFEVIRHGDLLGW